MNVLILAYFGQIISFIRKKHQKGMNTLEVKIKHSRLHLHSSVACGMLSFLSSICNTTKFGLEAWKTL